ncbi:MAG: M67 family metallopeptidase [Saprospiraceae bacterium]
MEVQISGAVLNDIHSIAEKNYPYECCGFIYGSITMDEINITLATEVINDSGENKRVHYTIPPKAFMKAERYAIDHEIQLIGVFHSHPDHPPKPSSRDLADALPELSYFITSVHQGQALDTRSWRLTEDRRFIEEQIEIIPN